ncbi:MAG: bifunctional metallophosphatase/5'-nucleotidase [Candidatus Aminicenantales bacterium]
MKRKLFGILVFSVLLVGVPYLSCGQKTLTILHTNDTHSALFPFGPQNDYGGIARMSTLIKSFKSKNARVLVLNAGDVFVGSFAFNRYLGYPELKIMENLYDAMELGNHEFDLGLDALAGIVSGAPADDAPVTMPLLCANINLSAHPDLASFVKPSLIKELGGMKIGIIGVVNADAQNYSAEVAALLTDPFNAAGTEAAALRAQGCEIVICVSHLGLMYDVAGLSQVPGIDIIVGGHSHDALKAPIFAGGKIIVQAGDYGKYLGELKVSCDGSSVALKKYVLHKVDRKIGKDPKLQKVLNKLRVGVEQVFGPVFKSRVATADRTIDNKWPEGSSFRDTALGNFGADGIRRGVQKNGYSVDMALDVMGYIVDKIYKGKVVGNDILRIVPYGYDEATGLGFKIDIIELDGGTLLALLEYSVSLVEYTSDFCLDVSGITFAYDSGKPAAPLGGISRVDPASVMINGEPINPAALYKIAVSNQIYNTLIALGVTPYSVTETGLFEYNLVRDYAKSLKHLRYKSEGRIIDTVIR